MKTPVTHNYQSRYSPTSVIRVGIISLCASLFFIAQSHGNVLSWSGGGSSGNWNDSGNWGFVGTPANGDTLIFSAGQPRLLNTNNVSSLILNQVRFVGAGGGYGIYGNNFTLTNSIEATNSAGANIINNAITLSTVDIAINVGNSTSLALYGVLGGSVGLIKNGGGTLTLAGPSSNTYGGATTVNAGLIELNKLGVVVAAIAIPGNLIVGGGPSSATVRNLASNEIADSANVTINTNGLWDLNNTSDTMGTNLAFSGDGDAQTGTGTLTLSPNGSITVTSGYSILSGKVNVNNSTFSFSIIGGALAADAAFSGSATITKSGSGSVGLWNSNSFTGPLVVDAGYVFAADSWAFGTTNGGTTVNGTAYLGLGYGANVPAEALTLNSTRSSGALLGANGSNSWSGPVTLGTTTAIDIYTNTHLNVVALISGSGGFAKSGPGTLTLSGPGDNSYAGNTIVNEGVLELGAPNVIRYGSLIIGDGLGGASADVVRYTADWGIHSDASITVNNSGWLDLNGFYDDVGLLTLDSGRITTGTNTMAMLDDLTAFNSTGAANGPSISGNITLTGTKNFNITNDSLAVPANVGENSGSGINKTGNGTMYLQGSNSYSGLTLVQKGILWVTHPFALGTTTGGTVVSNNASLAMLGNFGITNESLTLNGIGVPGYGNLDSETNPGTNYWAGPITVNADNTTLSPYWSGTTLRIIGPITGAGGVQLYSGNASWGQLYFDGASANTYAGSTIVPSGTLLLNKSASEGAVPHDLIINGTVRNLRDYQIDNSATVTIGSSGLLDLTGGGDGIGGLNGSGSVNLGTNYINSFGSGSYTFNGVISGLGTYYVAGNGNSTLSGTNTYTGETHLFSGSSLTVNGYQPQSPVWVSTSATFGGSGTVGSISCSGNLRPGDSPGILTGSNMTFTASGSYGVELTGPTAGTDYDQVNVRGTNNLASATLSATVSFTDPVGVGQQFVIINNDGADPITGTFAGLADSATFTVGSFPFRINYNGGTGNDVVLTLLDVPGAQAGYAVSSGNGNQTIDPNECNSLSIVITNKTGTPMTGVSATLLTTNSSVMITQPESAYTDVPAYGRRTNTTPFQISTFPSFVCGSNISLLLAVNSSLGSFSMPVVLRTGGTATVPVQYDMAGNLSIPDTGTVESTNTVAGFSGPLMKVAVSLYLTHTYDADLTVSLIAPDGTTVPLTSGNGGGGQNYGTACSPDSNRTVFDDAAATPIASGVAPFVGTFRPQGTLANFVGVPANGNWRLRVTDCCGGSLGTLRCWSLFLYPVECGAGGGPCELCPNATFSSAMGASSPTQTGYVNPNGVASSCGVAKACPGTSSDPSSYPSESFTFRNGPSNACITVTLENNLPGGMVASAYLGSFNPENPDRCLNYLGDAGIVNFGGAQAFSFNVAANTTFVVNLVAGSYGPYKLTVSGGDCRPVLNITSAPANRAHLDWSTSAGGYKLESVLSLALTNWFGVTNEPIVSSGRFNVTNITTGTNRFYRLTKPQTIF